jgi:hypothetical protein
LADFGFTSEGTSREAVSRSATRGTPGYTAPELMSDSKARYNNKVDIWSMGCILYELAVGTKAFRNDWAVIAHRLAGRDLEVNLEETFGDQWGGEITGNIILMLQIDPQSRPSATGLFETFGRLCRSVEGLPPADGEFETLEEAYTGLSLQVTPTEATLHKSEECRRIDEIIKSWKDADIDILAQRDFEGKTAIHKAAADGDLDKIKALKELGANFKSVRDISGITPICSAASGGHGEAIKLLKEFGDDVSEKNNKGQAPIHFAAWNGQVVAIKVLKELGADLSVTDYAGYTPIHQAASNGQVNAIYVLKELGVDASVMCKGIALL